MLSQMGLLPRQVLVDSAKVSLHLVSLLCLLIQYSEYISDGYHDKCFFSNVHNPLSI